jgi:hypothetical protein
VRGASYLADRLKVDAGLPQFVLASVDLVAVDGPTQHISRFLPSVRCGGGAARGRGGRAGGAVELLGGAGRDLWSSPNRHPPPPAHACARI